MAQIIQSAITHQPEEQPAVRAIVSLIRGGPFYRAQQVTRLIRPDRWNLGRRITFAVSIGWLPLVVMTAAYHESALRNLLNDYRVTARVLIAIPVLLLGQVLMESRFRMIVQHLREIHILNPAELARLDSIIARLLRWRDSIWPELGLIALVYANVSIALTSRVHETRPWALAGEGMSHLLPAGWYYSQLIYNFSSHSACGSGFHGRISLFGCRNSIWILCLPIRISTADWDFLACHQWAVLQSPSLQQPLGVVLKALLEAVK